MVAVAATVRDMEPLHDTLTKRQVFENLFPPCWRAWAGEDVGSGEWAPLGSGSEGDLASWRRAVSLFLFFWWGCVFPVSGMGFFPCWHTWAGEDVGSGVRAPAGLGLDREPASWSCSPCEVRWVLSVFLPWTSWRGAVFLSSSFGWECVVLVSGVC